MLFPSPCARRLGRTAKLHGEAAPKGMTQRWHASAGEGTGEA